MRAFPAYRGAAAERVGHFSGGTQIDDIKARDMVGESTKIAKPPNSVSSVQRKLRLEAEYAGHEYAGPSPTGALLHPMHDRTSPERKACTCRIPGRAIAESSPSAAYNPVPVEVTRQPEPNRPPLH